jgi:hypothetical protein
MRPGMTKRTSTLGKNGRSVAAMAVGGGGGAELTR